MKKFLFLIHRMGIKERRAKFQDKKSLVQKPTFTKKTGFKGKQKPQGSNKKFSAKKFDGKKNLKKNRKLSEPEIEVKAEIAVIKKEPKAASDNEESPETKQTKSFIVTLSGLSKVRQNDKAVKNILKAQNITATKIEIEQDIQLIYSQKKHALKVHLKYSVRILDVFLGNRCIAIFQAIVPKFQIFVKLRLVKLKI